MKPDLEGRLRRVEDELAIRALAARFSDCANERDYEGFADLWSAKAVWEIGPPLESRAVGVDAIVGMLRRLLTQQVGFMRMTQCGVLRIDGPRATARFIERELGAGGGPNGHDGAYENLAVHEDALAREIDGKWRFLRRTYLYRHIDTSDFGGRPFGLAAPKREGGP